MPENKKNKVKFNLKNAHYALLTVSEEGKETYNGWYSAVYMPAAAEAVALQAKGAAVAKVPAAEKAEA